MNRRNLFKLIITVPLITAIGEIESEKETETIEFDEVGIFSNGKLISNITFPIKTLTHGDTLRIDYIYF